MPFRRRANSISSWVSDGTVQPNVANSRVFGHEALNRCSLVCVHYCASVCWHFVHNVYLRNICITCIQAPLCICLCVSADYVSGGEMFTHLYQRDHFPEEAVRIYIGEIILALEHLHKVGFTPSVSETSGHIFQPWMIGCRSMTRQTYGDVALTYWLIFIVVADVLAISFPITHRHSHTLASS